MIMNYATAMEVNQSMCKSITYLAHDIFQTVGYDMGWDTDYPSKSEYVEVIGDLLHSNIIHGHDSAMKEFYNKLTITAVDSLIGNSY